MSHILTTTGAIFVLIAVGFVAVRRAVLTGDHIELLGHLVLRFALPALIFQAVAGQRPADVLIAGYMGGYLAGTLALLGLALAWSRLVLRQPLVAGVFNGFGMSFANSGFIGYPLLLMVMPAVASTVLALNMLVENLVLIPLALALAEYANGGAVRGWRLAGMILHRLARNPIMIAAVCGLALALLGIGVPAVLARPIELTAAASAPLSLLFIGGTLARTPIGALGGPVLVLAFGKLVLHPLFVGAGFWLALHLGLGLGGDDVVRGGILIAATPVMTIYPILAQRYGQHETAALAMFVMTILSFVTLNIALLAIDALLPGTGFS
ncbi:MAG: AEC family transporter [Rhodobacterales bacterium]|nr:AEC family transporter [Rhodobacterales bacterium]